MGEAVLILVGAIGGGLLSTVALALFNRGKTEAEAGHEEAQAADILTRAATDLLTVALAGAKATEDKLTAKVAELERTLGESERRRTVEHEELTAEVHGLREEVAALRAQLVAHGLEPVSTLPQRPPHA